MADGEWIANNLMADFLKYQELMTMDISSILPVSYSDLYGKFRITLADFLLHFVFMWNTQGVLWK